MNVAIVSAPPSQCLCDKLAWVADGFRAAGHVVRRCHTLAEVRAADKESDLLVFDHKNAGVCHNSLIELAPWRKSRWVQWWRDLVAFYPAPLREQPYTESFRRLMQAMDLVLVKERSLLKGYADFDIKARWFDQGCPADMPACEHPERPEYDVLVLGSPYPQRSQDAKALADAGFRVIWAGLGGPIPPGIEGHAWVHPLKELPALVSRCGVVLGVDWRCDLPGYTSDRTYLAAGMGACYVARSIDYGVDTTAPNNAASELASYLYFDQGSLVRAVRAALADRGERELRGLAARERVMAKHTYKHRAEELLALVEKELQ